MALYMFVCTEGHVTDIYIPSEHRDDVIPCAYVVGQGLDIDYMADIHCRKPSKRILTTPAIQGETVPGGVHGGSGDGYVLDSKSGLTSRRPKRKKWA